MLEIDCLKLIVKPYNVFNLMSVLGQSLIQEYNLMWIVKQHTENGITVCLSYRDFSPFIITRLVLHYYRYFIE